MIADYSFVLFDMDGVLWDSNRAHQKAYQSVFESVGLELVDYRSVAGRRTDSVIREALLSAGQAAPNALVSQLTSAKRVKASQYLTVSPQLMPNCERVLTALNKDKKLALVSSSSHQNVSIFLNNLSSPKLFASVICGEDVQIAKPHPQIYLHALQLLGAEPEESVVIEDSFAGIEAGMAAGIDVFVKSGTHSHNEVASLKVAGIIKNLEELLL